ncbi:MAG: hypothetical protein FJZ64_04700 [Chlamydiae bacterium]|nr:hypothetical protein [Chlamydiota bacterium]
MLLNRLKTLSNQKEEEVVNLDDLSRDKHFPKKAAERILQNKDMYSLYRKVYVYKEKEVERNLELAAAGKPTNVFADTKDQNGCCRIGQTKVFASNIPFYLKNADSIRKVWLEASQAVSEDKPDIVLYLHMISTIVSAEEVFQGKMASHHHKDEIWIWIPKGELAVEMLKRFLHNFQNSPGLRGNPLEVEFLGDHSEELSLIFKESFIEIPHKVLKKGLPIASLRFKAGSLNSRKAMVTPFLPVRSL